MNAQIRRLFFVFAALFVALVAMSTYWLWKAPDLEARRGNPQLVVRQVTIKRGLIYAANGKTIFATNRKRRVQGRTWYLRRYPTEGLVARDRRVLDHRALADRPRGVAERLPDRFEREPADALRQDRRHAQGHHPPGQRRGHDDRRAGAEDRHGGPRRQVRLGRGSRSSRRPRPRNRFDAHVRP